MSADLIDSDTFGEAWVYLVAPLVLVVVLYASRRLHALRGSNARLIWIVAIADVAHYVAAGYSLGLLFEGMVTGTGLDWQFVMDGELPKLTIQIAVFMGVARLVEVWLLSLDQSNTGHSMSRLTRTLLYGMGFFWARSHSLLQRDTRFRRSPPVQLQLCWPLQCSGARHIRANSRYE